MNEVFVLHQNNYCVYDCLLLNYCCCTITRNSALHENILEQHSFCIDVNKTSYFTKFEQLTAVLCFVGSNVGGGVSVYGVPQILVMISRTHVHHIAYIGRKQGTRRW